MSIQIALPLEKIESNRDLGNALVALLRALTPSPTPAPAPAPAPALKKSAPPPTRRVVAASPPPAQAPAAGQAPAARQAPGGQSEYQGQAGDFLELLRKRGPLTSAEAMKALGIKDPKAFGGLIGRLTRWASKHGGKVPMATTVDKKGQKVYTLRS